MLVLLGMSFSVGSDIILVILALLVLIGILYKE